MVDLKEIASYAVILIIVLIAAQHLNVVVSGSVYDAKWYNQPVIHRVIDIVNVNGSTMYLIKGDNNNAPDPYYVSPNQIQSKVVTIGDNLVVIPKIGYLSLWLRGL